MVPLNNDMVRNRNRDRSDVAGRNGMVCTSQPLASMAGIDALRNGGNAVDAAVAANAVLSVVEPMNCGPGGDLFAIVWVEEDKRLYGLNASGRSPFAWTLEAAQTRGIAKIPTYEPVAWSVPGCVSGWQALLDRFGRLGMKAALEPAIEYASQGFAVTPVIAHDWFFDAAAHPSLAEVFMPDGRAPAFGDVFCNPHMAESLRTVARGGADAFYEGEIAERIVAFSENNGGYFSLRDFREHSATWVEPVTTSYRGYDVWELPPNGQGIAALQMLNMLEQFDMSACSPGSPEHLHLIIEAKKLAFEDRAAYYADMDLAHVPVRELISKAYGRERAKRIDPGRAAQNVKPGSPYGASETIYLTAADGDGNMVSLIQSTYHGWGSHIVPGKLGFPIQNRGCSFSLTPGHANVLEGHKRPFHTIIPAFVTRDNRPVFSFGVMGGDFQPQGHVQILLNIIDFGMSPQQAGDQPRVAHSGSSEPNGTKADGGGRVSLEPGIATATAEALAAMGHAVRPEPDIHGGYQGIWREEGPLRYFGGSDPRKDGCAVGF